MQRFYLSLHFKNAASYPKHSVTGAASDRGGFPYARVGQRLQLVAIDRGLGRTDGCVAASKAADDRG